MPSLEPILFPVLLDAATDPVVRAVAAYLARYRGQTRVHTESDLRSFLVWCRERGVDPLGASRAQVELYVLDARSPSLPALDREPSGLGDGGLLPDLCH